ncbi:MAG: CCA tRNA nucleotidyltransferase [Planctomycetota bacterium]
MDHPPTDNPSRRFAADVAARLRDAGHVALFAGGCVRDELLGQTPKDYDVATDATPDRVREIFGKRRTLAVGAAFGVIIVLPPKDSSSRYGGDAEQVEVATFRTEGPYTDGRRPDGVVFATPEEDARRRDFTINGLFMDPATGEVIDHVGGRDDLNAGVIRAIGDPRARMTEDKLRLLRAVRFAARMNFEIDPATADAIKAMADQITVVSGERIGDEIKKMLAAPNRRQAVEILTELRLFKILFPEAIAPDKVALDYLERIPGNRFESVLAALLSEFMPHPVPSDTLRFPERKAGDVEPVRQIAKRLRLSNDESDRLAWLVSRLSLPGREDLPLATRRRLCTHSDAPLLSQIALIDHADLPAHLTAPLPDPLLDGSDLIALGLTPGPAFTAILDDVRDAQLEGELNSKEDAVAFIKNKSKPER